MVSIPSIRDLRSPNLLFRTKGASRLDDATADALISVDQGGLVVETGKSQLRTWSKAKAAASSDIMGRAIVEFEEVRLREIAQRSSDPLPVLTQFT